MMMRFLRGVRGVDVEQHQIVALRTGRPAISREFGKSVDWLLTGEEKK